MCFHKISIFMIQNDPRSWHARLHTACCRVTLRSTMTSLAFMRCSEATTAIENDEPVAVVHDDETHDDGAAADTGDADHMAPAPTEGKKKKKKKQQHQVYFVISKSSHAPTHLAQHAIAPAEASAATEGDQEDEDHSGTKRARSDQPATEAAILRLCKHARLKPSSHCEQKRHLKRAAPTPSTRHCGASSLTRRLMPLR